MILKTTHRLKQSNNDLCSYHAFRKETRKYYLSLGMDFQKMEDTIEVNDDFLSTPEKYTVYYGDLILENVSKPVNCIYKVSGVDNLEGSIIVFHDNTFQYTLYDDKYVCKDSYIGKLKE